MGIMKNSIFALLLIAVLGFASAIPAKHVEKKSSREDPPAPTPSPDFRCPNDAEEGGFHAHPTSCSKYFHCSHGLAWLEECDAGLHFNPATEQCDWPENANCQIGGSTTTPNPGTGPTTTGGTSGTTTQAPPGFVCPLPEGNFRDPADCAAFYSCVGSVVIGHQVCPDGLLFNPAIGNCDFSWNVDCD